MASPINAKDSRLKILRAEHHLNQLNRLVELSGSAHKYTLTLNPKTEPTKYALCLNRVWKMPEDWSLFIGDFAHNARSALDVLMFQLCDTSGLTKNELKFIMFPICTNSSQYDSAKGQLKGASSAHLAIIESHQPYKRRGNPADDPLMFLSEINIFDKHRLIPVVDCITRLERLRLGGTIGSNVSDNIPFAIDITAGSDVGFGDGVFFKMHDPIEITSDTTELGEFVLPVVRPDMRVHAQTVSEIKFGKSCETVQGRSVLFTLRDILDRVKEVVREFAPQI